MERALFLSKATAGHRADASGLQQLQAVKDIRVLTHLLSSRNGLGGQRDFREGVHGPLCKVAGHALHCVEAVCDHVCTPPETGQLCGALLVVQLIGLIPRLGWVHQDGHAHLADGVGTKVDGGTFVHLVNGTLMDVGHLHIPSTQPALPASPLGNGVERKELCVGPVGLAHLIGCLFRADEGTFVLVDVFLVDLISHKDNALIVTELDELCQVLLGQALPCRISWVDEH
mmetsp:Transcript_2018/g.3130  ORF Transcript_2018/g.3130 Transcript_2018/m.3130 type:complete len:229 (+) Transcript_2018:631-1317(+)